MANGRRRSRTSPVEGEPARKQAPQSDPPTTSPRSPTADATDADALWADFQALRSRFERQKAILRASAQHFRLLYEQAPLGYQSLDAEGRILDVNPAWLELLGYRREDVIGRSFADFLPQASQALFQARFARFKANGRVRNVEFDLLRQDGAHLSVSIDGRIARDARGAFVRTHCVVRDLSEQRAAIEARRQTEIEREETLELLRLMNAAADLRHLSQQLTAYFQRVTGCEAVGVRLRDGDDYPYYESRGFPPEFIAGENRLCLLDADGVIVRDGCGNPVLECMCGNILCGRFDPTQPFFTPHGSFWTNSTTGLLAGSTPAARQARTRNRCHGEGFESVALLPLRANGQTMGLFQFNDSRPNRFSAERIAHLERLVDYVAIGVAHRQAVAALAASEERYRRIVETAHEGIWSIDGAHRTTFVNQHLAAMLGYTPSELLGRPVTDFMFPEDLPAHAEEMQYRHQGYASSYERRFRRKDGGECWTIVSATTQLDERGAFAGSFGMFTDINKRKRAERAAQLQAERFRLLTEATRDAVFDIDLLTGAVWRSDRYAELFGIPECGRVDEHRWEDRIHPDDRPHVMAAEARLFAGDVTRIAIEYRLQRTDGAYADVLQRTGCVQDPAGKPIRVVGTLTDITERKRALEQLRESEERYRLALRATNDVIWDWDVAANTQRWNANGAVVFGWQDIVDRPQSCEWWVARVHPEDRERVSAGFHAVVAAAAAQHWQAEYRFRRQDGSYAHVLDRGFVMRDERGAPVRMIGAMLDITERIQAAEALRESEETRRVLLNAAPDSSFLIDREGTVLVVNETGARRLGRSVPEVVGGCVFDFVPAATAVVRRRWVAEVLRTKEIRCYEDQRGDLRLEHHLHPVLDAHGEVCRVAIFARDVTATRRMEAELRAAEEEARLTLDATTGGIWKWDLRTGSMFFSPRYYRMLGYEPDEFPATYDMWAAMLHPDDRAEALRVSKQWLANKPEHYESAFRLRTKAGTYRWIESRATVVGRDEQGVPLRLIGSHEDITERKEAEQALRESEQRVQRKLRAVLEPEGDLGELTLADILDTDEIQSLMTEFHQLTGVGVGFIDLEGRVLVATGWQDICTRFHRVHPQTLAGCRASDLELSRGTAPGEFRLYRCKNNMWDMATPIVVGGRHVGNLFLGQFLFEDELPDYEAFRAAARTHGFDEAEYLAALDRVPRWTRATVEQAMRFYTRLAGVISNLSYANLKLARTLAEREQLVAAQEEAVLRQQAAVRAGNVGLWDWDLKSNRVHYSAEWKRQIGYEPDEIGDEFDEWQSRVHPDDLPATLARVRGAVAVASARYHTEFRLRHKDGSYRWILAEASVIPDESGHPVRMIGSHVDITERKQTEEVLRASEERFRTLVTNLPGVAFRCAVRPPWRVHYCSEASLDLSGYPAYEFTSGARSYSELVDPQDLPGLESAVADAIVAGQPVAHEHRLRHADGSMRWVMARGRAVYDADGAPVWLDGVLLDVTSRRLAEEDRLRLATVIEQAAEAVVITDTAGRIQYVNNAFERITGYTRTEALGQNPRMLQSGHQDRRFYEDLWKVLTRGETWHGRFVNRRKDGSLYQEEASIAPVFDGLGKLVNFVAVKRDITQELAIVEQLRQAQKMEAVGQLAAGVAHDFNNLLTAIYGYVDLARQSLPSGHAALHALHGIEIATQNAVGVVRGLLTFSGRTVARRGVIDVRQVLRDARQLLRRLLPARIALEVHVPEHSPLTVNADPTHMQQVLMNLAVNARDAMPDGGVLRIATGLGTGPDGVASGETPGSIWITVSDTGLGMPPEVQARIFEPFFSTKATGAGTGLGLSITQSIITEHGGTIEVTSAPGAGTTFRVMLPWAPETSETQTGTAPVRPARGDGELVLLAEDDQHVRAILAQALDEHGFQVLPAADGTELWDLYARHADSLRLLILDVDLPRRDGLQCLAAVRARGCRAPAIVITAQAACSPDALGPGDVLLPKPFALSELLRCASRLLARVKGE